MNGRLYFRQQIPRLLLHLSGMILLAGFLALNGNGADSVILILSVWIAALAAGTAAGYRRRKKQLDNLLSLTEQLPRRCLIAEVMEKPERAEDQVWYRILKTAGKSMLEEIGEIRREQEEYREYIEQWIHEIKTPIAAAELLCENNRRRIPRELLTELEKIGHFTEQALYYARSGQAEKDYLVREIRLFSPVHQAIAENKYLLLENGVRVEVGETEDLVFSDGKWLCFILSQLILNAVRYRSERPLIRFRADRGENEIILSVEDNGVGIEESDLPRIFEKGFTGKNGREISPEATGIGLYLCRRLCGKLGIGIRAESSPAGTAISLTFPMSDYILGVREK